MAASAAKEAVSRKVSSGSSGQADFSVDRGEGRDDVDIARSNNYDDKVLPRGDSASFPVRQSKVASVRTENASVSSKRSNASVSSLSIKTEYINNGTNRSAGRINKFHTANSPVVKIKRDDCNIVAAPKQSNMSMVSATKSCKSLSSIISNRCRSHESSGRAATTKPIEIETVQIHKSRNGIHNNLSSQKEHSSIPRKELLRSELEYWSGLSVRVAMAVIQANGSGKMAQKASNIVLEEGRRQCGRDRNCKMMRALSAKLSVIVLEAGADQNVALAVVLAVLADESDAPVVMSAESMLFDDSSTIQTDFNVTSNAADEMESVASTLSNTIQSNRSKSISVGPSKALIRSQLNSLELQILEKQKSIEEAALWKQERQLKSLELQILEKQKVIEEAGLQNQEREKKFNKRIAAYEAVTGERLAALDKSTVGQQDKGHTKGNIFQRGIDDFAWWGCFLV